MQSSMALFKIERYESLTFEPTPFKWESQSTITLAMNTLVFHN
jgi:hypothetical protein